jgi:hypothetical protein
MSRKPDPRAAVERVINGKRVHVDSVHKIVDGQIRCIARIVWSLPADGAAPLRVAVFDWGPDGQGRCEPVAGTASGFGYDKAAAALTGLKIGGVELGGHCDPKGRPLLADAAREHGWTIARGSW